MITLYSDGKIVQELQKLKQLQLKMKISGKTTIKDEELDRLSEELKNFQGMNEKEKALEVIKKLNQRLEILLKK